MNLSTLNPLTIFKLRQLFKQKLQLQNNLIFHVHLTWLFFFTAIASLGLYYKSRYLSNALKLARHAAIDKSIIRVLAVKYPLNIKSIICFASFMTPNLMKKIL